MQESDKRKKIEPRSPDCVDLLVSRLRNLTIDDLVSTQNFELAAVLKSEDLWKVAVHSGLRDIACKIYGYIEDDRRNIKYVLPDVSNDPKLIGYLAQHIAGYLQSHAIDKSLIFGKCNLETDSEFIRNLRLDIHNEITSADASIEPIASFNLCHPSNQEIKALEILSFATGLDWVLGQSNGWRDSDPDGMAVVGIDEKFAGNQTGALLRLATVGAARELQKVLNQYIDEIFEDPKLRLKIIEEASENGKCFRLKGVWLSRQVFENLDFQKAISVSHELCEFKIFFTERQFSTNYFMPIETARTSEGYRREPAAFEETCATRVAMDLSIILGRKVQAPIFKCDDYKLAFSKTDVLLRFKKLLDSVIQVVNESDRALTMLGFDSAMAMPTLYLPKEIAESKFFRELLVLNEDLKYDFWDLNYNSGKSDFAYEENSYPEYDRSGRRLELSNKLKIESALTDFIRDRISSVYYQTHDRELDFSKLIPTAVINYALVTKSPFKLFSSDRAVEKVIKEILTKCPAPINQLSIDTLSLAKDLRVKIISFANYRDENSKINFFEKKVQRTLDIEIGHRLEDEFGFSWQKEGAFFTIEFTDSRIAERFAHILSAYFKKYINQSASALILPSTSRRTVALASNLLEREDFWQIFQKTELGRIARDLRHVDQNIGR